MLIWCVNLDLVEGVLVGALDEDGDGERVLALLHKGKLVLTQHMLVHHTRITQAALVHIVNAVHGIAATGERQPLHVPPLGPPQAEDPLLGKGVQGEGIHALLVDHHKAFVRSVANLV